MKKCKWCVHVRSQHDEDGFCEQQADFGAFCDCPGYEEKETEDGE